MATEDIEIRDVNYLEFRTTPTCPPNLIAIYHRAVDAIEQKKSSAVPGPARIVLVLPGMSKPSAATRFLAGRNSPRGEIVADGDGNTQLVSFECLDLLAWMTARGFLAATANGTPVT